MKQRESMKLKESVKREIQRQEIIIKTRYSQSTLALLAIDTLDLKLA